MGCGSSSPSDTSQLASANATEIVPVTDSSSKGDVDTPSSMTEKFSNTVIEKSTVNDIKDKQLLGKSVNAKDNEDDRLPEPEKYVRSPQFKTAGFVERPTTPPQYTALAERCSVAPNKRLAAPGYKLEDERNARGKFNPEAYRKANQHTDKQALIVDTPAIDWLSPPKKLAKDSTSTNHFTPETPAGQPNRPKHGSQRTSIALSEDPFRQPGGLGDAYFSSNQDGTLRPQHQVQVVTTEDDILMDDIMAELEQL